MLQYTKITGTKAHNVIRTMKPTGHLSLFQCRQLCRKVGIIKDIKIEYIEQYHDREKVVETYLLSTPESASFKQETGVNFNEIFGKVYS